MRKTILFFSRFFLTLGVLVALTPCGVCDKMQSAPACSMKSMSGKMDCCHKGKQPSPLCKIMDQSSTVPAANHAVQAPVVAVQPVVVLPVLAFIGTVRSPSVVVDTSPFRAPLSLRI